MQVCFLDVKFAPVDLPAEVHDNGNRRVWPQELLVHIIYHADDLGFVDKVLPANMVSQKHNSVPHACPFVRNQELIVDLGTPLLFQQSLAEWDHAISSRHGTHLYPFVKQPQLFIRQSAFVVALTEVDKDAAEYEEGQVIRVSDHVFDFGH